MTFVISMCDAWGAEWALSSKKPTLLNTSTLANLALGLANSPKPEHQHLKGVLEWHSLTGMANKGKDVDASAAALGPETAEVVNLVKAVAYASRCRSFHRTS